MAKKLDELKFIREFSCMGTNEKGKNHSYFSGNNKEYWPKVYLRFFKSGNVGVSCRCYESGSGMCNPKKDEQGGLGLCPYSSNK